MQNMKFLDLLQSVFLKTNVKIFASILNTVKGITNFFNVFGKLRDTFSPLD